MQIEQSIKPPAKNGHLRAALFDFHGVMVTPGHFNNALVTDREIEKLEEDGAGKVLRKVPFEVSQEEQALRRNGNGHIDRQLRQEFMEGRYSPRLEIWRTMFDLAEAGILPSICTSLDAVAESAFRAYLRDNGIWSRLNPDLPVILRANKRYPALAYKMYAIEEALRTIEQIELLRRFIFQRDHPQVELAPLSTQFAVIEDNINISIPAGRMMRLRNMDTSNVTFYVPVDPKHTLDINPNLWPESTRDVGNILALDPEYKDKYVIDPNLSRMRQDFGLEIS